MIILIIIILMFGYLHASEKIETIGNEKTTEALNQLNQKIKYLNNRLKLRKHALQSNTPREDQDWDALDALDEKIQALEKEKILNHNDSLDKQINELKAIKNDFLEGVDEEKFFEVTGFNQKDLYQKENLDIYRLEQKKYEDFYKIHGLDEKILYLIKRFQIVPDYCFDENGSPNKNYLKLEKVESFNGFGTEALFFLKVKYKKSEDFKLLYVIKVPKSGEIKGEIKGLMFSRALLPGLWKIKGIPQIKFHEKIFLTRNKVKIGYKNVAFIFLHAAKGMPWNTYYATEKSTEKLKEGFFALGRAYGLFERHFLRGNWEKPETLYTMTFLDAHPGNVFYDPKTKKFSWIDISSLGKSAAVYYKKAQKDDFTRLGSTLSAISHPYRKQKDYYQALLDGYFDAFNDLNEEQQKIVKKLVLDYLKNDKNWEN